MRAADYAALSVCVLTLLLLLPGFSVIPPYASIMFHLFIPGYAFVRVFFTQISGFEKLLVLIAFSIAISTFVEVLIKVFEIADVPGVAVSSFLSIVMLVAVILRNKPRF